MLTQAPRGTYDLYGQDLMEWKEVEKEIETVTKEFRFQEIRTPIFEHTELFLRGIGDTTDIVQKEMYTFEDKGGRSITMRPEWTAGVGRAYLEHSIYAEPQPTKFYYVGPCFRYEKPQAGRDRQFSQFGCEVYGAAGPAADVEVMAMAYTLLQRLGITNVTLHLNSLGCSECRARYNQTLTEYLSSRRDELCPTCQDRLTRNPLRVLDCKSPICQGIVKGAPSTLDSLDAECRDHFDQIIHRLEVMQIPYVIDTGLVRGLDYYTRTVFEFVCNDIGAQGTVCGGGRYDHLIEELGGSPTPAVGFGMGIGRLILARRALHGVSAAAEGPDLFIGSMGTNASVFAGQFAFRLRQLGCKVEIDLLERSVKAQMKYANKLGARYTMIIGDTELEQGTAGLKNMQDGTTQDVNIQQPESIAALIR
jgi:histidyl-tRNA synthetase